MLARGDRIEENESRKKGEIMKFTTEEIALCKKIAEKHRKEIYKGDWYIDVNIGDTTFLCQHGNCGSLDDDSVPLWQISDCLEFLRERGYRINLHENVLTDGTEVTLNHPERLEDITNVVYKGKTPLEACLKAVLAIVEE
jgi:hypothetical protein